MIVKIIQSLLNGKASEIIEPKAAEGNRENEGAKLIDVAQQVLSQKAAEKNEELKGIVKYGWPHVKKEKFKKRVRKKVWDAVSRSLGFSDDDVIEEITERIADVAEVDPYYQKIFDEKGE